MYKFASMIARAIVAGSCSWATNRDGTARNVGVATRLVINEWSEPLAHARKLADMDEFLASIQIG